MNYQSIKKQWAKRREGLTYLFQIKKMSGPELLKKCKAEGDDITLQRLYQIVGKRKKDP